MLRGRRLAEYVTVERLITFGIVTAAALFVFVQLQPSLIFRNSTPAGGDMGAHVWGPAFLRDSLLPNLRITGWAPDWYAGFPAYHFYFPLPSLIIVALDVLLPYGVAFKVVAVSGLIAMPVAAWAFGRLSGMRFPGPALLGAASLLFLFDRGFTIYGGNIPSTLAGEFSFSIGLSLSLVFLGFVARGLDTGRHRATAGVLLALAGLSHLLPTVFAVVGAILFLLLRPGRVRARFLLTILGVGALLAAFWSVPFLFRMGYANDMGWEKLTQYWVNLFPPAIRWVTLLAGFGALFSFIYRRRTGLFLVGMAALAGALFVVAPQGRLWNARVLPFWYLAQYFLAAVAVTELGLLLAQVVSRDGRRPLRSVIRATPVVGALGVWLVVGTPLGVVPDVIPVPRSGDTSFIPGWATWNFTGYEGKTAYPEYKAIIDTMAEVGETRGCGRAHWEYEGGLDRFGTPMALMLLPYWTHGCIGSMEGLYFESSATTPYHFLNAGEVSKAPSNPQRDLPYRSLDLTAGIEHLQLLGTRYYMAFSPEAVAQADVHPDLQLVSQTGQWRIYEIAGSQLVVPLDYLPAVVTGIGGDTIPGLHLSAHKPWLDLSVDWYMDSDPTRRQVMLAQSGPDDWPRVALEEVATDSKTVGAGVEVALPARQPTQPTRVSGIRVSDDRISFDVSEIGQPVLVKASYFPNWKVSGADGPWRVTPNLMVVVPTSTHVELRYGYTPVDIGGWLLTAGGIAAVFVLRRQGTVNMGGRRRPEEAAGSEPADEAGSTGDPVAAPDGAPERVPVRTRGG